jgi:hypothetical protein
MKKNKNNEKGILLVIASVIMAVVSVLTGVYLSSMVSEKRGVDTERYVLQAVSLAEAGADMAMAELRKRFVDDLSNNVINEREAEDYSEYVEDNDALGFLQDFAYVSGQDQVTISGNEATLTVNPVGLESSVEGNSSLSATITIASRQAPTEDLANEEFYFYYTYKIESTASITNVNPPVVRTVVFAEKNIDINVRRENFAKFALFTDHHHTPGGTTVWFTENTSFSGPVHTNDRFSFAHNPSAVFTEDVTQQETKARYYNGGSSKLADSNRYPVDCCTLDEDPDCENICVDKPAFAGEFTRGVDIKNLQSSVSQIELADQAKGASHTYENESANISSRGVHVRYRTDTLELLGGVYIYGNQGQSSDDSTVTMSVVANKPVYTIKQTISSTIYNTEITVDAVSNQTSIRSGTGSTPTYGASTTYTSIPDGQNDEGILIYSNDDIKSFSGTVQQDTQVTVSSERDIVIQGNVLYESYTPDDAGTVDVNELSAMGSENLLGIFSWGGDVRIGDDAPDGLNIHGVVMAKNGVFTVDEYDSGSSRGTVTLLGGAISQHYGAFGTFSGSTQVSGYGRKFVYDSRVLSGMAPPYFPYLDDFNAYLSPTGVLDSRPVWKEE